jgi:hypothetical protein
MRYALLHDQYEAFTGDIPSPSKEFVLDPQLQMKFEDKVIEKPSYEGFRLLDIVKAADLLEAALFLTVEINLGNYSVTDIRTSVMSKLEKHLVSCGRHVGQIASVFRPFYSQQDPLDDRIKASPTSRDNPVTDKPRWIRANNGARAGEDPGCSD